MEGEELGGLIMCDLKSNMVFWGLKLEQASRLRGHSWVPGYGSESPAAVTFYLCSDLQLPGTSSPQLHTLTYRQASQSPARPAIVHILKGFDSCKPIDVIHV